MASLVGFRTRMDQPEQNLVPMVVSVRILDLTSVGNYGGEELFSY
jgi:hypothetical protein